MKFYPEHLKGWKMKIKIQNKPFFEEMTGYRDYERKLISEFKNKKEEKD